MNNQNFELSLKNINKSSFSNNKSCFAKEIKLLNEDKIIIDTIVDGLNRKTNYPSINYLNSILSSEKLQKNQVISKNYPLSAYGQERKKNLKNLNNSEKILTKIKKLYSKTNIIFQDKLNYNFVSYFNPSSLIKLNSIYLKSFMNKTEKRNFNENMKFLFDQKSLHDFMKFNIVSSFDEIGENETCFKKLSLFLSKKRIGNQYLFISNEYFNNKDLVLIFKENFPFKNFLPKYDFIILKIEKQFLYDNLYYNYSNKIYSKNNSSPYNDNTLINIVQKPNEDKTFKISNVLENLKIKSTIPVINKKTQEISLSINPTNKSLKETETDTRIKISTNSFNINFKEENFLLKNEENFMGIINENQTHHEENLENFEKIPGNFEACEIKLTNKEYSIEDLEILRNKTNKIEKNYDICELGNEKIYEDNQKNDKKNNKQFCSSCSDYDKTFYIKFGKIYICKKCFVDAKKSLEGFIDLK